MQKINWNRVILGGLLAGLVINICECLANRLGLGDLWDASMKNLHRPPMGGGATAAFLLWGFLIGIYALWLYATLRPRMGPGPKTAAIAGFAVWILGSLFASIGPIAMHLFPYHLMGIGLVLALVEIVAGAVIGAWLYKEPAAA
jgi:hypothetical protein